MMDPVSEANFQEWADVHFPMRCIFGQPCGKSICMAWNKETASCKLIDFLDSALDLKRIEKKQG